MQAHHLISKKAMKLAIGEKKSKDKISKADIEALGYDINALNNLVFIPSTLPGACHLKVQLHRGNHVAGFEEEDDFEPKKYHNAVKRLISDVIIKIDKGKYCQKPKQFLQKDLDKKSKYILQKIEGFDWKLTSMCESFHPSSNTGCCNETSTTKGQSAYTSNKTCSKNRNHAPDISWETPRNGYKLKVGQ